MDLRILYDKLPFSKNYKYSKLFKVIDGLFMQAVLFYFLELPQKVIVVRVGKWN